MDSCGGVSPVLIRETVITRQTKIMNIFKKVDELNTILDNLLKTDGTSNTVLSFSIFVLGINGKINVWKEYGAKTFVLSKDLIEAFKYTDVPLDSYPTDFQYPFPTFMIESEGGPLFTTKTPLGVREVFCILYVSDEAIYKNGKISLIKTSGEVTEKLEWSKGLTGFYTSSISGSLEYIKLHMVDHRTIKDAAESKSPDTLLDADEDDTKNMVNLFYNAVMYINDPDRDKIETESCGSRKLKIGSKGHIKSNYILLKAPKSYVSLSSASKSWVLDERLLVRGHWKKQAHGEKSSLRKRIWIKPYYKGPEFASVENKPYKVV